MRILLLLGAAALCFGQDKADLLRRHFEDYHRAGQFDGAALVSDRGAVVFRGGFGHANREWGVPNAPDVKFRLASITKQFTAAVVLQLVEERKLKLDGVICDYIPEYPPAQGKRVTIHQLLNHSSGIPSYTGLPEFMAKRTRQRFTPPELVKEFWDLKLEFDPGTKFAYNNSAYFLLGWIIERVDGRPYARALEERIFAPLGMRDSGYDLAAPLIPKRAAGYRRSLEGHVNSEFVEMTIPYAAGSLYSTVDDLHKWDQALYTDRVLPESARARMFAPGLNNYGYGWMLSPLALPGGERKLARAQHGGGIFGFATLITRLLEDRHLVVLLTNTEGNRWLGEITEGAAAILYGQTPRRPREAVSRLLSRTWKEKGVAAAVAQYRELKAAAGERYDFREPELNTLGYALLREAAKPRDAIEIFKLNVEAYPKSANVHDSLGEAYVAAGEKAPAIASYEKALELAPGRPGPAAALRKLRERP